MEASNRTRSSESENPQVEVCMIVSTTKAQLSSLEYSSEPAVDNRKLTQWEVLSQAGQ
jgi:hypothetical protein